MDKYSEQAYFYRKELDKPEGTEEQNQWVRDKIMALEAVAEKSEEQICGIFDTGAFHHIVKAYAKQAMKDCHIGLDDIERVMDQLDWELEVNGSENLLKQQAEGGWL